MIVVRHLNWDPGNVAHIARHSVTPEEVEQLCQGPYILRQAYRGRMMILAVVLELEEEGVFYPVTARPASRKERQRYREEQGGEMR